MTDEIAKALREGAKPWLSQEGLTRLIGARDGLSTAIVIMKRWISSETMSPIPTHHKREIREREARLKIPREVLSRFEQEMQSYREAIEVHTSVAPGRTEAHHDR